MMEPYVVCPLCGLGFERQDTLCAHGCPLGTMCRLIRCPGCEYEFPETPAVSWLARFLGRPAAPEPPDRHPSLLESEPGQRVRVLCLGARSSGRHLALVPFGLVPGCEIQLLQRRPACVIRVDETELALDPDIAREILVERLDDGAEECRKEGERASRLSRSEHDAQLRTQPTSSSSNSAVK